MAAPPQKYDGFFQYANNPGDSEYEFGYNRGNAAHYTSRYEQSKDSRFRTKVTTLFSNESIQKENKSIETEIYYIFRLSGLITTTVMVSNIGNTTMETTTLLLLLLTLPQLTQLRLIPPQLIQFRLTPSLVLPLNKNWRTSVSSNNITTRFFSWRWFDCCPTFQVILFFIFLYVFIYFYLVMTSSAGQLCHFLNFSNNYLFLATKRAIKMF